MTVEEVEVNGIVYKVAAIKTGQMRTVAIERQKNPDGDFLEDNIKIVVVCLNNAGPQNGGKPFTEADIEDMEYPSYRPLLNAAQRVSGFIQAVGETKAPVPQN